jgi:ABC-2 type transport system ATP-binding protein
MEVVFRECITEARSRGQSVFLSSHILSEVEALCDRVGILREGRLGALLGAPAWPTGLSPFAHLGLPPAQPFRPGPAVVMVLGALGCALLAVSLLERRDIEAG